MWKDPIVEEIHAVREEIARRFDYDLKRIADYFRSKESAYAGRVVRKEDLARRRAPSDDDLAAKESLRNDSLVR